MADTDVPGLHLPHIPTADALAWTHVLCDFCLFFNTFRNATTLGVFQNFCESPASTFRRASSDISWIGSIQAFLLRFVGLIIGPIYDKGYLRYWQVLLAWGFCAGLGMGCLYLPSVSILPSYFSTRLGLAVGLASSGSAVGGVIYPIVLQRLIQDVGFAWALRVVGFVALITLSIPVALMRDRSKSPKARALVDRTAFADTAFMWFAIATSIGFMGNNAFQIFFSFYAAEQHITSMSVSFNLVSIHNGMSALARTLPNAVSDKFGQWNVLTPSALVCSAVYYRAMAAHSEGPTIGVTILSDLFLGVLTALPPVCFAVLTKDKNKIGSRIGIGFAIIAPGILIGGLGAGGILQRTDPLDWRGLYIFTGTSMLAPGVVYTALRVARSGLKLWIKA